MALRRSAVGRAALLAGVALRAALFALLWWALVEGDLRYPLLAAGVVLAATTASLLLVPVGGAAWHPLGALRFIPFFVRQSLLGGMDVARRALDPRLPVAPDFIDYRLRLPAGPSRAMFTAVVSLLPGTLSTELGGEILIVHALDQRANTTDTLRRLEERVADLYGVGLSASELPDLPA